MNSLLALPRYTLVEQLYQGSRTVVCRAVRDDRLPVVIKVLRQPHPSFGELVQFRNQFAIAAHLDHPNIVRPLTLEHHGNGYALVMPDEGYIPFSDYWAAQHHDLADVLSIAIQLAEALHYLMGERVIHKDIKPSNLLIHPESQQVQLIDFSIASLLPKEQAQLTNPNVLEGTLAYLSPEQTGRMNRGMDYRTDYYSLGVTLFELLAGALPFTTTDPIELVHSHMARQAVFPEQAQRESPAIICDIIQKLMAKAAEDRYQSALGLKHDLEQCLSQWTETGDILAFELGTADRCDRFLIPEKLYGRETEVQNLLTAFERVSSGHSELMLVVGFSGIGKTAVVNEVHQPITRQHGYFIKGKFDQFNRNVPFSAFVQAFRCLIKQLLGESDTALQAWKNKILDAVGTSGQVILEVIPELERIIGLQPQAPNLSGRAARNRFNVLFGTFVRVFTTAEHPLVLFLDDLQWADSNSLNLLQLLLEKSIGHLLIVGAYRENEVFPAHPLLFTLAELERQGISPRTLNLAPLNQTDVNHFVADTLLCSPERAVPLSQLVFQKTQGNPFFITQFLQGLHEEKCIIFETDLGYWSCDLTQVRRLAVTDDITQFVVGRLQKLPDATQTVLQLAACIGNRFDLEMLAVVCDREPDAVAADLWWALHEGLVMPESEIYKFFQGNGQGITIPETITTGYRFLHDRVQQAAYTLIPAEQQQSIHVSIGQRLLHSTPREHLPEHIFAIVN